MIQRPESFPFRVLALIKGSPGPFLQPENNTVKATRVILPVNNEKKIPERFGLRHRAAIGITERTDALALVVSEETGQVSYIKNGEFIMFKDTQDLTEMVKTDLEWGFKKPELPS